MSGFENDVLVASNVNFENTPYPHPGIVTLPGQLLIGTGNASTPFITANTLTAGTGITITNGSGSITVSSTAAATDLHVAKWIVNSASNAGGNQSTIQAAINAASSGDTIFIMPGLTGIYTENLTLKAGVNLTAFSCDSITPNVIIKGKTTFSTAGSVTCSGLFFQTNSDFAISVTGSSATTLTFVDCWIDGSNNTLIQYTCSNSASNIVMYRTILTTDTTGVAYFTMTSPGTLKAVYCTWSNVNSVTNATASAGNVQLRWCELANSITTSGTAALNLEYCSILQNGNTPCITVGGSGGGGANQCYFFGGTTTPITVTTSFGLNNCVIGSPVATAINGAGTVNISSVEFQSSNATVSPTTLSTIPILVGNLKVLGNLGGSNPGAGFLGEIISSTASTVSIADLTVTPITSINLTPGIWDITGLVSATAAPLVAILVGTNTSNSAFSGSTEGIDYFQQNTDGVLLSGVFPVVRASLSSNTTYYLLCKVSIGGGACTANGKITATRVG